MIQFGGPQQSDTATDRVGRRRRPGRARILAIGAVVSIALVAGCAGNPGVTSASSLDAPTLRRLLELLVLLSPASPERALIEKNLDAILESLARLTAPPVTTTTKAPTTSTTTTTTTAPTTTTTVPPPTIPEESSPATTFRSATTTARIGSCEIFPPDHFLNATNIDQLPPADNDAVFKQIRGAKLHFNSSSLWMGSRGGMPINVVDSTKSGFKSVTLTDGDSRNYRGRYPIPHAPLVEGAPGPAWDRHLLTVDTADCTAYELIQYGTLGGAHSAWMGAKFKLDTVAMPAMTTNAADTPMVGQYVMRDEVAKGDVPHVLSWCTNKVGKEARWPARRSDGNLSDGVPMGAWIRLKPTVDLTKFTGDSRPVVEALATRGAVMTDTCGHAFSLHSENSATWNDSQMRQLSQLSTDDFDVVDATQIQVSPNSFQVR